MTLLANANSGAWPDAVSATVTTHHRYENGPADNSGWQIWSRNSATAVQMRVRTSSGGVWSPWTWIGGQAPHHSAYRVTAQAMATANTWYTATYDTTDATEGGMIYSGGVITVPVAGKYQVNFAAHIQNTTSTTSVSLGLLKNGVSIADYVHGAVGGNKSYLMSKLVKCAAGDTLYARAKTSTAGTNLYGAAGTRYTYIDITLVGG